MGRRLSLPLQAGLSEGARMRLPVSALLEGSSEKWIATDLPRFRGPQIRLQLESADAGCRDQGYVYPSCHFGVASACLRLGAGEPLKLRVRNYVDRSIVS